MAEIFNFKKPAGFFDFIKRIVPEKTVTPKAVGIPGPKTRLKPRSSAAPKVFNQRPDDRRLWNLWMSTYDLPSLVLAHDLRIFTELARWPQTMEAAGRRFKLSARAGESLLGHLVAMKLLVVRAGKLQPSALAKEAGLVDEKRAKALFPTKVRQAVRTANIMAGIRQGKLPFGANNQSPLSEILDARFAFPFVVACQRLGFFEALEKGNATTSELARRVKVSPKTVTRIVKKLVGMKILFRQYEAIGLTELARTYLLESSPDHWLGIFDMMGNTPVPVDAFSKAVTEDRPNLLGKKIFETHELDPKIAKIFARHMHSQSAAAAKVAAETPVFDGIKHLADIGGGWGTFSLELAKKHKAMRFTIVELKNMAKLADARAKRLGLSDRVGTEVRNFFKPQWPKAADAILFSNIFHDWSVDVNKRLARNSFAALPPGGKIILHEMILDESKTGPHEATGFSLCMVVLAEGKQYTRRELTEMLTSAGFVNVTFTKAHGPYYLVSASKPR